MNFKTITAAAIILMAVICVSIRHEAGAAGKPTIFLKNLVPDKGVSAGDSAKLSKQLEEIVINMSRYDVMSQDQVKELFETVEKQQMMMDCNSEECLKQILSTTQTDFIIYGEIFKEDNEYVVSVKLMERRKGGNAVVTGSSTRYTRTFDSRSLKLLAENIIKQIHGQKITESEESKENDIGNTPEGFVKFRVLSDPIDSDLYILGKLKKSKHQTFPEGKFEAELKRPGYEDYKFTIDLPSKTEYNITMERSKYDIVFNLEKGMDPGVEVYEENNLLGTIDESGLNLNLESGGHILTFKMKGFDERVETYNFTQNRNYAVKLKKKEYDLKITSSEVDTQVYINEKPAGKAPYSKKIEYGIYNIRMEKDGFLSEMKEIELDKSYTLNFTMREKKFVEFRVETKPEGAKVYYGGKQRGTAPGTFQLPEGNVKVEVEYDGMTLAKEITLEPGGKTQVVNFDFKYCNFMVESIPEGADVYIDGIKSGKTPASFSRPEGGVRVWVKRESDGKNKEKIVKLTYREKEQKISFDLTQKYEISDRGPAGGWVFYDKGEYSDGWRYLEAAPVDQSTEAEWRYDFWNNCCLFPSFYILLFNNASIPGARGTAIGTGKINTQAMVKGWSGKHTAAELCVAYRGGDKNDWFLPSKDELNLMYVNLKNRRVGNFADNFYWSSSEFSVNSNQAFCRLSTGYDWDLSNANGQNAWYQSFYSGYMHFTDGGEPLGRGNRSTSSKGKVFSVRAVRAF